MANKTFWKGTWHEVDQPNPLEQRGRLGPACPPFVEGVDAKWVAEGAYGASGNFRPAASPTVAPLPARPGERTCRVLTPADPFFQGKFGPARLEERLNELFREGWCVVGMAGTALDPMVILERVVVDAPGEDSAPDQRARR
jgi:hypothetical protein